MNTAVNAAELACQSAWVQAVADGIFDDSQLVGFHAETERARLTGALDAASVEQLTEIWFHLRVGRITGSRIGKILGLANPKWGNAETVMRDMVREYHGLPSDFVGNVATQWGNDNEATANAKAEEELEDALSNVGIVIHPEYPWLAESPDGIWFSTGNPNQTKCPFGLRYEDDPQFARPEDKPDYVAQMQLSCEVTDKEECSFVQWNPYAVNIEWIKRDRDWFASVLPVLKDFHNRYLEIIASPELSAPYLKELTVERDDAEWLEAVEEYKSRKESVGADSDLLSAAKDRLVELSAHRTTKGGGVTVSEVSSNGTLASAKLEKLARSLGATDEQIDACRGKPSTTYRVVIDKPKKGDA